MRFWIATFYVFHASILISEKEFEIVAAMTVSLSSRGAVVGDGSTATDKSGMRLEAARKKA